MGGAPGLPGPCWQVSVASDAQGPSGSAGTVGKQEQPRLPPSTTSSITAQMTCGLSSKERVGTVGRGDGLGSQLSALQIEFLFKEKHTP